MPPLAGKNFSPKSKEKRPVAGAGRIQLGIRIEELGIGKSFLIPNFTFLIVKNLLPVARRSNGDC